MEILVVILALIAGISKAVKDVIDHKFNDSVFNGCVILWDEWNPAFSWRNKYKQKEGKIVIKNNRPVDRFFLSSTVLVFLTDAWHFFGFLQILSIFAIALLTSSWWIVLMAYIIFHVSFHTFYTYIFHQPN